jgi:ABC-2 type transport system ATP-binding protein
LKVLLRQLAKSGTTVFLSTHTLDIAQELADRVGVIHNGKLIACDTVEGLRKKANSDGTLEDVFMTITAAAGGD